MRQFFLSLPKELEESGLIDGANRWQVFSRIVLPLAKPALATLAIFTLLGSWNDLVWPLIAINNDHAFTWTDPATREPLHGVARASVGASPAARMAG
jgi:multiple sugar transport system permease protein